MDFARTISSRFSSTHLFQRRKPLHLFPLTLASLLLTWSCQSPTSAPSTLSKADHTPSASSSEDLDLAPAPSNAPARRPQPLNPRPRAWVNAEEASVTGGLVPKDARLALLFNRAPVNRCYIDALADDPNLAGTLTLHIEVDAQGLVTKVSASGELAQSSAASCILSLVKSWEWPKRGEPSVLSLPLKLEIDSPIPGGNAAAP
jgi:hypothetical protein